MRNVVGFLVSVCLICAGQAFAAHTKAETSDQPESGQKSETTQPGDAGAFGTPKGALRAYDAALPSGGMNAATEAYYATTDAERKAADAMAKIDLITSKLQQQTRQKFGSAAADIILHAARNTTDKDLNDAAVKTDGDHATVDFDSNMQPVPMIQVDGKWRISMQKVVQDVGGNQAIDDFVKTCQDVANQLQRTADELSHDQYPNVTLLERAIRQRMYRVLGDEK